MQETPIQILRFQIRFAIKNSFLSLLSICRKVLCTTICLSGILPKGFSFTGYPLPLEHKKPGREIFRVCALFALGFFCVGKNASEKAIVFFHPDCTVGFGVSVCSHCRRITESCPAGLYSERLVGYTTGWDLHPTLKNFTFINVLSI